MSQKKPFVFTLRRNVAYDAKHAAIYDKLKTNAGSPFYQMDMTKTFITAMSIGIMHDSCIKLKKRTWQHFVLGSPPQGVLRTFRTEYAYKKQYTHKRCCTFFLE